MTNINHICCCCNVCKMNLLYIRCDVITINFLDTYVLNLYINNVNITIVHDVEGLISKLLKNYEGRCYVIPTIVSYCYKEINSPTFSITDIMSLIFSVNY